ncbi:HNH endonuclease domain-containing protein [Deinococcus pimensis]|uniref:HNH endonuclease domain-containing protein n=1 Tax=Deinococcus pimensis TaxID=309888 RepID=UPI00047F3A2A|nr:HNH endonuclease domain-containing protein [Deinococcus pimensis]
MTDPQALLASILRHDAKLSTYKIALVRALGDVRLSYLDVRGEEGVAVPLRLLAEFWLAYYWPFMDDVQPVWQGPRTFCDGVWRNDVSFRPALTQLRNLWRELYGPDTSADGFTVIHEMRTPRRRASYPSVLREAYGRAITALSDALRQPIRYAGPGLHTVFPKPAAASVLGVPALPGTSPREACLLVTPDLWDTLARMSLWVEALCVYEWSAFALRLDQDRSEISTLLTTRPDNRRPLSWERNQVELLMLEGHIFTCPWTHRPLSSEAYDLDHVLPVSVYPINELWNLVPSDRTFNQHKKRDRLPGLQAFERAMGALSGTYAAYHASPQLSQVLSEDVSLRFGQPSPQPTALALAVSHFVSAVADARNLARF